MKDTAAAVFMAGILVGATLIPTLSDMFGRKLINNICVLCMFIVSVVTVFVNNVAGFLVARFFDAVFTSVRETYQVLQ